MSDSQSDDISSDDAEVQDQDQGTDAVEQLDDDDAAGEGSQSE
jgi:hypothetical protein